MQHLESIHSVSIFWPWSWVGLQVVGLRNPLLFTRGGHMSLAMETHDRDHGYEETYSRGVAHDHGQRPMVMAMEVGPPQPGHGGLFIY